MSGAWSMNCSCILDTPAIHGGRTAHVKPVHGRTQFGGSGDSTPLRSSTCEVQDYGFVLMEVAEN